MTTEYLTTEQLARKQLARKHLTAKHLAIEYGKGRIYMENMLITPEEFHEFINGVNRTQYQIVDLRDKKEYVEYHAENAVNIEYDDFMEIKDYSQVLDRNKTVLLYCDRGGRSIYAARRLGQFGYQVKSLAGGMNNYMNWYKS